ncbi:MAG TPA: hypothetical protein ACFCUY_10560 [Xenococcaceae cyanobacterium]
MKTICSYLLAIALSFSLISCGKLDFANTTDSFSTNNTASQLSETAPPRLIQQLKSQLISDRPQVEIITPKAGITLTDTTVKVQLSVQDFPLFQDAKLGLGSNLHLILDNEPYITLYSVDEPIELKDLTPGTHTLRVVACTPWHETFKTQGAYAQTTFNILTETEDNHPDPNLPLLTYSSPQGNYSAEPVMLDFYLKEPSQKNLKSGEVISNLVQVTVNDETFTIDQWEPIYLQGFKEGNNIVQLELIDSEGHKIDNAFNNTVRLITYNSESSDALAKIVTNQISLEAAQAIIDPDYDDEKLAPELTLDSQAETQEVIEPKVELETEIAPTPASQKAPVVEVTPTKYNEPVLDELELETVETTQKSPAVPKLEVVEPEINPTEVSPDNNLDNAETTVTRETEAVADKEDLAQPILEAKSISVTDSETRELPSDNTLIIPKTEPETTTIVIKIPRWITHTWDNIKIKVNGVAE